MSPRQFSVVSANLGCGGPHGPERARWAEDWLAGSAAHGVDLLLAQEAPPTWKRTLARDYEFSFTTGADAYRCRSLVAIRVGSGLTMRDLPFATANYHGSYVAAARVVVPKLGEVSVLSVHASPTRPSPPEQARWPDSAGPLARPTGGSERWDSDFALETVRRVRRTSDLVLAAGDWNEARAWDLSHRGTWGAEFFETVKDADLVDCTHTRWKRERATHQQYQDDHVFASQAVDNVIGPEMALRPLPGSDHTAIAFVLEP